MGNVRLDEWEEISVPAVLALDCWHAGLTRDDVCEYQVKKEDGGAGDSRSVETKLAKMRGLV